MSAPARSAHTPGPWRATEMDKFNQNIVKPASAPEHGGDWIALVCDFNRFDRDAEREANARLIATAPELLAALLAVLPAYRVAMQMLGRDPHAFEASSEVVAARAAIRKATEGGQP